VNLQHSATELYDGYYNGMHSDSPVLVAVTTPFDVGIPGRQETRRLYVGEYILVIREFPGYFEGKLSDGTEVVGYKGTMESSTTLINSVSNEGDFFKSRANWIAKTTMLRFGVSTEFTKMVQHLWWRVKDDLTNKNFDDDGLLYWVDGIGSPATGRVTRDEVVQIMQTELPRWLEDYEDDKVLAKRFNDLSRQQRWSILEEAFPEDWKP